MQVMQAVLTLMQQDWHGRKTGLGGRHKNLKQHRAAGMYF